jgi:hypothetical protein
LPSPNKQQKENVRRKSFGPYSPRQKIKDAPTRGREDEKQLKSVTFSSCLFF